MKVYLGIDVGSISTKLALIDKNNNVLSALYFRTEGDPIRAIQKGLKQLKEAISDGPGEIEIAAVGTTGSARYLAGVVAGADLIKNEISAHAKGASFFTPDVKTVIEIGGQDSKIIILESGVVVDFAMNLICLKGDTKITTNPDYTPKPIQDIVIGEKILTHTGMFKPVEQVFERKYQGEMLKIEISNLKKLDITPEHSILGIKREDIKCYQSLSRNNIAICKPPKERTCQKRCAKWKNFSFEPKFISANEFKKGDFIATPLPTERNSPTSISYSQVETKQLIERPFKRINEFIFKPDLLRLLGYYLAEGSILYNRARWDKKIKYPAGICLVFNIKEQSYIKDIKKIISQNFPDLNVILREKPDRQTAIVEISSKSLAQYIKYLCGAGADEKRLSPEILNLEPSLQKEALKGFFRGDGQLRKRLKDTSISNKTGNRYVASTVSETLAYQLYWLLLRNKIKCTLYKRSDRTTGGKYAYILSIYGKELNKLEDKILVNPQRQGYKSFIYSKWIFEPIRKIRKYKFNGMVYNLNVKDDHSYVANLVGAGNCAAGTGSFLDAQAFRLGIPVEEFGAIALKSKQPTIIGSRCTVFCESDMIHKQQIGHSREDIIAGLCHGLARNFLANVAKGKKISPPIVFLGGVSENLGMRKAFEEVLGEKIIIPKYNTVLGALGVALLAKENIQGPTKFRGWEISSQNIKCTSFQCKGCPNLCEVIEARIEGKIISRWNDRCGKFSTLTPQ
jgi:activator of 2-hydroxyglutaryl-CoA dehydratase/intein/homing endonuclease